MLAHVGMLHSSVNSLEQSSDLYVTCLETTFEVNWYYINEVEWKIVLCSDRLIQLSSAFAGLV